MAETTYTQTESSPYPTDVADVMAPYTATTGVVYTQSAAANQVGYIYKGIANATTWIMWAVDIPSIAYFTNIRIQTSVLAHPFTAGVTMDVVAGILAFSTPFHDGQAASITNYDPLHPEDSPSGWGVKVSPPTQNNWASLPHPARNGSADALWAGTSATNSPSFDYTVPASTDNSSNGFAAGDFLEWNSSTYSGSTPNTPDVQYTDSSFLTAAREVWKDSGLKSNRDDGTTAIGGIIAFMIYPKAQDTYHAFTFPGIEHATAAPAALIVQYVLPEADINDSDTVVDASPRLAMVAASELSGDATLDADADLYHLVYGAAEPSSDASVDASLHPVVVADSELSSDAAVDANLYRLLYGASEATSDASTDADGLLTFQGSSELSSDASLDGALFRLQLGALEASSDTTLDGDFNLDFAARSELLAEAALDASPLVEYSVSAELSAEAVLDSQFSLLTSSYILAGILTGPAVTTSLKVSPNVRGEMQSLPAISVSVGARVSIDSDFALLAAIGHSVGTDKDTITNNGLRDVERG